MRCAMARTRDWNCLRHITWTINREYQAIWRLPTAETKGKAAALSTLKKYPSFGNNDGFPLQGLVTAVPASGSSSTGRGYAKGAYNHEQEDGAEGVIGAGKATSAGKSDAVGEEMRVDSFVKVDNVPETDSDGLIEKAKKAVKKVGEKVKDASDYMRTGAEKAEEKEETTTQQVVDATGDTVKEAAGR